MLELVNSVAPRRMEAYNVRFVVTIRCKVHDVTLLGNFISGEGRSILLLPTSNDWPRLAGMSFDAKKTIAPLKNFEKHVYSLVMTWRMTTIF